MNNAVCHVFQAYLFFYLKMFYVIHAQEQNSIY